MNTVISLDEVRERLKIRGYSGLYVPGECGCHLGNLAPCGSCEASSDGEYINDCAPGYFFSKPGGTEHDWMVRGVNEVPSADDWQELGI